MSELLDKQLKLGGMIARLIIYAESLGYEVKFGAALVHKDDTVHKPKSLHRSSLAVDLLLFKDKKYLTKTEDYLPLGLHWEEMGGTWGGRFGETEVGKGDGKDGNHFSIEMWGMK